MNIKTAQKEKGQNGFTLIELIVVLGIMAILTVGLLISVDPLEHLARARDTNRRRLAIEYFSALQRFISVNSSFPWGLGATAIPIDDSGVLATLISTGELSKKYESQIGKNPYTGITLTTNSIANGGKVWVCFNPESKSISRENTIKYSAPGNGSCNPNTDDNCYYCAE